MPQQSYHMHFINVHYGGNSIAQFIHSFAVFTLVSARTDTRKIRKLTANAQKI
jgi:hypothetical protein